MYEMHFSSRYHYFGMPDLTLACGEFISECKMPPGRCRQHEDILGTINRGQKGTATVFISSRELDTGLVMLRQFRSFGPPGFREPAQGRGLGRERLQAAAAVLAALSQYRHAT
jgi:hypothetical protein